MTQLRQSYSAFQEQNIELAEVGPNVPEVARRALRQYLQGRDLEFPYLCDPSWAVHKRYGLQRVGAGEHAKAVGRAAIGFAANRPFVTPAPGETARLLGSSLEQGLFGIDEEGLVRYVHITSPSDKLPAAAVILDALAHQHA